MGWRDRYMEPDLTMKDKLTQAFKILRKMGYIALQNHLCCGNCAGYDIAKRIEKMDEAKRSKVLGCVFYHNQDTQEMWNQKDPGVHLAYGPVYCNALGTEIGEIAPIAGKKITQVLDQVGLKYEWDGDACTKIWVSLKSPEELPVLVDC